MNDQRVIATLYLAMILVCGVGCAAHTDPVIPATGNPAPVVIVKCVPIKPYTPQQMKAVGAELKALPAGDPLAQFITDYGTERAALRACASSQ